MNRFDAVINQRNWPVARATQFGVNLQAKASVNSGSDFGRTNWSCFWRPTDFIGFTDDCPTLEWPTGKE